MATFLNHFLQDMMKGEVDPNASYTCWPIRYSLSNSLQQSIYKQFIYCIYICLLVLAMKYNNQMNYAVIAALMGLFSLDAVSKVTIVCTTVGGAVLGALAGFVMGAMWYTVFHVVGADELLYFDEMDSNDKVRTSSKQTF